MTMWLLAYMYFIAFVDIPTRIASPLSKILSMSDWGSRCLKGINVCI